MAPRISEECFQMGVALRMAPRERGLGSVSTCEPRHLCVQNIPHLGPHLRTDQIDHIDHIDNSRFMIEISYGRYILDLYDLYGLQLMLPRGCRMTCVI